MLVLNAPPALVVTVWDPVGELTLIGVLPGKYDP